MHRKIESIGPHDEKMFQTLHSFIRPIHSAEKIRISKQLAEYIKTLGLFQPLLEKNGIENIRGTLLYQQLLDATFEFCTMHQISLLDQQEKVYCHHQKKK